MHNIGQNTGIQPSTSTRMEPVTSDARHGQIGGNDVMLGNGDNAARRSGPGRALDAVVGFFKSMGEGISNLFSSLKNLFTPTPNVAANNVAANNMEAVELPHTQPLSFDQNRQLLTGVLPPGAQVSEFGVVSGGFTTSAFPVDAKELAHNSGKEFTQVLQDQVGPELSPKGPKQTQNPEVDGIKIGHQASVDFYRLDFTFGSGENAFKTREDTTKGTGERTANTVGALREFTGSDLATTTLSAVMTQNLSRMFIESFKDENGDRMAFTLDQGKEGTKLFRETDGEESMVKPGGIGSMPISLTRDENGDYKLEAKWDMFLAGTGRGFEKQPFPGMDGSMLKAEAKMTFTIDAQAASEGRLEVRTNGDPVSVSFEGRMAGGPPVDV